MNGRTAPGEGHLRVGTFHRERALTEIRNAAADDRISFDELEERVPRVMAARTRDDLAAVLGDLLDVAGLTSLVGEQAPAGTGPGWRYEEPLLLQTTGWHTLRIVGAWEVPPFVEAQYGIGGIIFDFTQAAPLAPLIDLVLVGSSWGAALLVVPDTWGVDTQGVQTDSSSSVTCTVPTRPSGEGARIILRGRVSGTVTVRRPTAWDERRAARLVAKEPDAGARAIRAQVEARTP